MSEASLGSAGGPEGTGHEPPARSPGVEGRTVTAYTTVEELLRDRISSALGGWRGALESALPTVAFVVFWTITSALRPTLIASVGALLVLGLVRVVRHETVRFIGYAAVAVAIAAFFALRSGKAQDAFLPGLLQSAAVGLAFLISNLVRWPIFGFLISAGDPELLEASERLKASGRKGAPQDEESLARAAQDEDVLKEAFVGWRRHAGIVSVASRLGWVFVGLYVLRLGVMVPLYLTGQVTALGITKIVLGWPAYLLAVLVMGLVILRGHTPLERPDHPGHPGHPES